MCGTAATFCAYAQTRSKSSLIQPIAIAIFCDEAIQVSNRRCASSSASGVAQLCGGNDEGAKTAALSEKPSWLAVNAPGVDGNGSARAGPRSGIVR